MIHVIQNLHDEQLQLAVVETEGDTDVEEALQVWLADKLGEEPTWNKEWWAERGGSVEFWKQRSAWLDGLDKLTIDMFIQELGFRKLEVNWVDADPMRK